MEGLNELTDAIEAGRKVASSNARVNYESQSRKNNFTNNGLSGFPTHTEFQ